MTTALDKAEMHGTDTMHDGRNAMRLPHRDRSFNVPTKERRKEEAIHASKRKRNRPQQNKKSKENLPLHLVGRLARFIIYPPFALPSTL